jgi:hypothetical protein
MARKANGQHSTMADTNLNGQQPATPATNTSALSNIDPSHVALDLAWAKVQSALEGEAECRARWKEGTHELINILGDARKRLGSDQAFGAWLTEAGYGEDRISRDDRSALLNMALHHDLTRKTLEETTRRSWRLIWLEEIQPRLRSAAQPVSGEQANDGSDKATTQRPKKKRRKTDNKEQKPEWFTDNRGWFNEQVESINAVVRELKEVMKKCTPEQHAKLHMTAEPKLLLGFSAENQKWFDRRWADMRPLAEAGYFVYVALSPLLGPVTLPPDFLALGKRTWVVVYGECNRWERELCRPLEPNWVRAIRDQCSTAGIPFFIRGMHTGAHIPPDLHIRQFPVL